MVKFLLSYIPIGIRLSWTLSKFWVNFRINKNNKLLFQSMATEKKSQNRKTFVASTTFFVQKDIHDTIFRYITVTDISIFLSAMSSNNIVIIVGNQFKKNNRRAG